MDIHLYVKVPHFIFKFKYDATTQWIWTRLCAYKVVCTLKVMMVYWHHSYDAVISDELDL